MQKEWREFRTQHGQQCQWERQETKSKLNCLRLFQRTHATLKIPRYLRRANTKTKTHTTYKLGVTLWILSCQQPPPWGSVPLKSIEVGFWDRRLLRINPCSVWKLCRQLVPDKHLNLKPLKLSWQIQFFYFWKLCLQAFCLQFCLLVFLILFSFFAFF